MFLRNFSDSVLFNLSRFLFLFLFPPFPSISSELVWLLGKLTKFSANSIFFFPALFILRFRVKLNCRSFSVTDKTYQLCIVLLPNSFLSLSQQPTGITLTQCGTGIMHGRYVDVAREKRGLDSTSAEEGQPDRKRPALARLIASLSSSIFRLLLFAVLDCSPTL